MPSPSTPREFVASLVADHGSAVPYTRTELNVALNGFVTWSHDIAALDLDPVALFTARNIQRYVERGLRGKAQSTKNTIRSRLFRIAERIDPHLRVPRQPGPPSRPWAPYSPSEVAALHSWASTQRTTSREHSAKSLLGLGLGAGLAAAEIAACRVGDLADTEEGLAVEVRGPRARSVPILTAWQRELRAAAEAIDDCDSYLFRPDRSGSWPNVISNFVGSVDHEIRPQTPRMRATWIVAQLAAANVDAIVEAAGVDSLEALARYLDYLPGTGGAPARTQLAGAFHARRDLSPR